MLKSNCKHVRADGVVRAPDEREISKWFPYGGGVRRKCNGHRKRLLKRSITLKNAWLPLHFMLWNGSGKPIHYAQSAVTTILLSKVNHLPCSFKDFLNLCDFLYVKTNPKEICEEISFLFFLKKCWCQHFCRDSRLIISKICVTTPIFLCESQ